MNKTSIAKTDLIYQPNNNNNSMYDQYHPQYGEWQEHQVSYDEQQKLQVPLKILSPITTISWMYMCESWRKHLDFDFQRPPQWTDDTPVYKFNHSWYVKYHNLFDWHDFALLRNDSLICPKAVVDPHLKKQTLTYYYIDSISYDIPSNLANANTRRLFASVSQPERWMPSCHVKYFTLKHKHNKWYLSSKKRVVCINSQTNWTIVDLSNMKDKIYQKMNNGEQKINLQLPHYQHPDVASNKPFIFVIFGSDAYHHTDFTGQTAMKTHGGYWWTGNYNPDLQFTSKCTFIVFQSTALASLNQILPKLYLHLQFLMQKGCVVWNGNRLVKLFGMVSHHIGDMQDRDIFARRRGANVKSRSDGLIWYGYSNGCRWPRGVRDLLEVDCVVPGNYLMDVWKFINKTCVSRGLWIVPPDNIGKSLSLTKTTHDVYNEIPLDSTLKAPIEINHTTLLGFLTNAFEIEWIHLHHQLKHNEKQTKTFMYAYLTKFWHNKNGIHTFLTNISCNILKFNQMQHSWQKMLEIMISLPYTVNWNGNLSLLTSLIRMTGCLFTCRTENHRLRLQTIVKKLLLAGTYLCAYLFLCVVVGCYI